MMWGWHDTSMFWWMAAGSVFWGIVVVTGIYLLARPFAQHEGRAGGSIPLAEPPLEIARRRYAAGEISEEEFKRVRDHLSA